MSTPTAKRPDALAGMRHVALFVKELEACEQFYTQLLGMSVEWRPDKDNVFLSGGIDNLALHRATQEKSPQGQRLDHIGFIINEIEQVDTWFHYLKAQDVKIAKTPKTHRDGARSFYCFDPDGTVVQLIFHPPISGQ